MPKNVLADMKSHMEKTLNVLKNEFQKIRTGRASTGILDSVKVDYYGNLSSISQVATLSVPEPRTITISPWEAKIIPAIEKAIMNSNIGLTPSNDGKTIRLNLPPLTEERRREIVKDLKKKAEDDRLHKISNATDEDEKQRLQKEYDQAKALSSDKIAKLQTSHQ